MRYRNSLLVMKVFNDPIHEFDSVRPTELSIECVHDTIGPMPLVEIVKLGLEVLNEIRITFPYPLNEIVRVARTEEVPLVNLFHVTEVLLV